MTANSLRKVILSGFGTGYLRPAPGTWGSAAVAGVFFLVAALTDNSPIWPNVTMLAILLLSSAGCVTFGRYAEQAFGKKDPSHCTIDEWAGQAVALLLFLPHGSFPLWGTVILAFLAFRIFDITKPFPARRLEKLPFGWGVLLDDIAAGIYANITVQLLVRTGVVIAALNRLQQLSGIHS